MTTIEHAQREIDQLLRVIESDLGGRGVLMIDRAQRLLSAARAAKLTMGLCEQTTPADFLNAKWKAQAKALQEIEVGLARIINGVRIPIDRP